MHTILESYIIDAATEGFPFLKKKPKEKVQVTPEELKKQTDNLIRVAKSEFSKIGLRISYDRDEYEEFIFDESTDVCIANVDLAIKHKFNRNDLDALTEHTIPYGKIIDGINENLPKDSAIKLNDEWDKSELYLYIERAKK